MNPKTVATAIAQHLQARIAFNEGRAHDPEWYARHGDRIDELCKTYLPSGSGVDCGTKFIEEHSTPDCLRFQIDFHHMDQQGGYDGWTEHVASVRPEFGDIKVRLTGANRNDVKTYLTDILHESLMMEVVAIDYGYRLLRDQRQYASQFIDYRGLATLAGFRVEQVGDRYYWDKADYPLQARRGPYALELQAWQSACTSNYLV